jgi:ABC-type dipeptide/oligopeptide/nickel transport system permease subunit
VTFESPVEVTAKGQLGLDEPASCHGPNVVVFYRMSLFVATLCLLLGIVIVIVSLFHPGLGLLFGAIILLGSYSLVRGLRRRILSARGLTHLRPA